MLTIALYVILSTLQSQTPSGLQKQASHPSHWEFHFFSARIFFFFFHLLGNVCKFPLPLRDDCFYTCVLVALQTCLDFPAALPVIYVAQG